MNLPEANHGKFSFRNPPIALSIPSNDFLLNYVCVHLKGRETQRDIPPVDSLFRHPQSHGWVRPKSGSPKLLQVSLVTGIHPSGAIPEVSQAIHEQKAKIRREGGTQTQPPPNMGCRHPKQHLN